MSNTYVIDINHLMPNGILTMIEEVGMRNDLASNQTALQARIMHLEAEHNELNRKIDKLVNASDISDLELTRLKKRKLKVKDNITLLQLQLEPQSRC